MKKKKVTMAISYLQTTRAVDIIFLVDEKRARRACGTLWPAESRKKKGKGRVVAIFWGEKAGAWISGALWSIVGEGGERRPSFRLIVCLDPKTFERGGRSSVHSLGKPVCHSAKDRPSLPPKVEV